VTDGRDLQSEKQGPESKLSEKGIEFGESEEASENPPRPMHASLEPDSNLTDERAWHSATHLPPSISTDEGIQNDESNARGQNAQGAKYDSIEPDSNVTIERESDCICRPEEVPSKAFRKVFRQEPNEN
jgi:hypothetical protein